MKRNGKKARKIRKLVIACTLSAVVLIVSTYTWFIGLRTVSVKPFEIDIAATEGLYLSLNGSDWSYEVDVTDTAKYYDNNTNKVNGVKLVPMSSVGDLDPVASTMKLYEKASLTTSPGGYRLLASRVNNDTAKQVNIAATGEEPKYITVYDEQNGYIAFDLFIKNLSGDAYYTENQPLNEEAIYLNFDSAVKVKNSGSTDPQNKTGIENSVRVAFTQIGRVIATETDTDKITGLTCNIDNVTSNDTYGKPVYTESTGVTGICRNAQIWEPNDTKHVANALNWYEKSCITRKSDGVNINSTKSYNVSIIDSSGNLTTPATYCYANGGATKTYMTQNANALPTYAISRAIHIEDNVDVYDGAEFNTYSANTISYDSYRAAMDNIEFASMETIESVENIYDANLSDEDEAIVANVKNLKLVNYDYFTDTEKDLKGMERPEFMTLAPNSITKVRVYIWLEGQDIDNYDFAQIGKTISINFGFTKERFLDTDVDYDSENSPMTREDYDSNIGGNATTEIPTTSEIGE